MRAVGAIVGATATGKTEWAELLAGELGAEIVCADARQIYRELELGTGKPSRVQRAERGHHLFEWRSLAEPTSAGRWARAARECFTEISARGAPVLFVGGSGLYLDALRHGLSAEPPRDADVRARLLAELESEGSAALHARLAAQDPETAARLARADRQRIVRALEVLESSGRTLSQWHREPRRGALVADWRVLELTCAPDELDRRIAARTHAMFTGGLLAETEALLASGHGPALVALRAIGYDEAMAQLAGRIDGMEAERRTSLRTRQLAKRQRTWFRHHLHGERLRIDEGAGPGEQLRCARALFEAPAHDGCS